MKYRQLGANGPPVSAIGLGCMVMSTAYGIPDDKESFACLDRALDLGINFFDTADAYGEGRNEQLLAAAFKGKRDRVFVATKFGNMRRAGSTRKVDGRAEYVVSACEASLRNLGVDTIDLYYQHRVDPLVPIEETVGAMKKLVGQGKVRYLGLSEASPQTIRRAHAVHPIAALQSEYSLWSRDLEGEVLATCRALGVAFIPYGPLGRGLLTGAIKSLDDLPPNDRRRDNPRFYAENLSANVARLGALEGIARRLATTPAQVALAWVLAQGDDIIPIPGTKRRRYLEENAAAVDLSLTAEDIGALNAAYPRGYAAGARNNQDAMQFMDG